MESSAGTGVIRDGGAMFETYVVSEIIKGYANQGIDVRSRMFSYRDNNEKIS